MANVYHICMEILQMFIFYVRLNPNLKTRMHMYPIFLRIVSKELLEKNLKENIVQKLRIFSCAKEVDAYIEFYAMQNLIHAIKILLRHKNIKIKIK